MRELSGAMGDLGTLFPLAAGFVVLNGLNPSGLLVMMGLANIVTGLAYGLPMPIEPMKLIAVTAIAQRWSPALIQGAGFGTGLAWLGLSLTGAVRRLAACTPGSVTAGIQLALGLLLVREGLRLALTEWPLALISLAIIVTLRRNRHVPAAPVLLVLGLAVAAWRGELGGSLCWGVSLPRPALFSPTDVWRGMVLAGFAQVALTLTNAVIATSALIREYWPERSVSEERLALSTGLMNLVAPFLGGMPMCHGAGGLAAQHYFGARTAGANILEGIMEVFLGLFLATSVARVFGAFPAAILGTMLLAVAAELGRLALRPRGRELVPLVATTLVALVGGTAAGFAAGLATHYLMKPLRRGAA